MQPTEGKQITQRRCWLLLLWSFCFALILIVGWYAATDAYLNSICIYRISKLTCQASHLIGSLLPLTLLPKPPDRRWQKAISWCGPLPSTKWKRHPEILRTLCIQSQPMFHFRLLEPWSNIGREPTKVPQQDRHTLMYTGPAFPFPRFRGQFQETLFGVLPDTEPAPKSQVPLGINKLPTAEGTRSWGPTVLF